MARHAFPDLSRTILALTLAMLGFAILGEASLSFAGLGAQPDGMSLGLMLLKAQGTLLFAPWLVLAPGLAATVAAGALHLAADGLRRDIEPTLRAMEHDDALA
jgi:peptide/nickel transport system permease protein